MKRVVLATGGFDPIHSGHIEYLKAAKQLGDILVVGLNSDDWLTRKKGQPFMPLSERITIIEHLDMVDQVISYDDSDNSSCDAIITVRKQYPEYEIIFVNGGDRTKENIPEVRLLDNNLTFIFGVGGGDKLNSSSWLLQNWSKPKTLRQWGYYRILHNIEGCKVKELTVEPHKSLSMQRHFKRNEYWLIASGSCYVNSTLDNGYQLPTKELKKHDSYTIPVSVWHQLSNPYDEPCHVIEIQFGDECIEEDIERKNA